MCIKCITMVFKFFFYAQSLSSQQDFEHPKINIRTLIYQHIHTLSSQSLATHSELKFPTFIHTFRA